VEAGEKMTTTQPIWEFVINLGDVNVADYGGFIVYRDTTGIYSPEAEIYEANDEETGGQVSRIVLDKAGDDEWYMDKLASVAATIGDTEAAVRARLLSDDIVERAKGYQDLILYFGAYEFDSYPRALTEAEAKERYKDIPRK
jgi:hypothetical protein